MISPNTLKMKYYKWFNKWYFKYKGIQYGKNMQVYNKVYVTGKRGKIVIGDDFTFTSGDGINPISRNIRGCIHTNSISSEITIGNHVGISSACIRIKERLTIGNHVNIGGNCTIMDTDVHQLDYLVRRGEKEADPNDTSTIVQSAPVNIEDDVWIGADCIAAGNPCKVIRETH